MALQDKVRDLTWYNLVEKSKEVLLEILENIENIWSRVKALEKSTANLPTYADNAAAIAGGLPIGDFYRTSTGVVMVRF
jgi:hypothetical protein